MASGENVVKRMRDIGAVEGRLTRLPIRSIAFYEKGHALVHPRQHMPVSRELVDSIKGGWKDDYPLGVHEEGRGNPAGLVHGSRRYNAGLVAETELIAEGKLKPKGDNPAQLMVPVVVLVGSELDLLKARRMENSDPLAEPDSPSVLSAEFRQMVALGMTHEECAKLQGNGYTAALVETLCQMPDLPAAVRAKFDAGEAPVTVMEALFDAAPKDRAALLDSMIESGATTPRKAKKLVKKATGQGDKPRRVSPAVAVAFLDHLENEVAPVAAVISYYEGDPKPLKEAKPKLFEKLEEIRATVRPGKKAAAKEE